MIEQQLFAHNNAGTLHLACAFSECQCGRRQHLSSPRPGLQALAQPTNALLIGAAGSASLGCARLLRLTPDGTQFHGVFSGTPTYEGRRSATRSQRSVVGNIRSRRPAIAVWINWRLGIATRTTATWTLPVLVHLVVLGMAFTTSAVLGPHDGKASGRRECKNEEKRQSTP